MYESDNYSPSPHSWDFKDISLKYEKQTKWLDMTIESLLAVFMLCFYICMFHRLNDNNWYYFHHIYVCGESVDRGRSGPNDKRVAGSLT